MNKSIKHGKFIMPVFSITWDNIENYCGSNFKIDLSDETILDLTDLDLKNKVELFDLIANIETNIIPSIFTEEYFPLIKNGRELHNKFYSKINMMYNLMNIKNKKGSLSDKDKYDSFLKMFLLIKEYKSIMEQLFNDVDKKEFLNFK